jgi:hypothetical protein
MTVGAIRKPRVAVSQHGLVFWTPEEDDLLVASVKTAGLSNGNRGTNWQAVEAAFQAAGFERTNAMLRNRYRRILRGKQQTESRLLLGKGVRICGYCGLPKAGHTCRAAKEDLARTLQTQLFGAALLCDEEKETLADVDADADADADALSVVDVEDEASDWNADDFFGPQCPLLKCMLQEL